MSLPTSSGCPFVRASVVGRRGMIELDRGKALNALTLEMIRAIRQALDSFALDGAVEFVTVGSTRPGVFCAGGDIRPVREAALAGLHAENEAFFAEEFALNHRIATYPKPYLALIDGVCMGGGMGVSVHGRYRVVTDALAMAMPETAIGYFPDVGASYFLNRLPGAVGIYLALTGARVDAAGARYTGLATHRVAASTLATLSSLLNGIAGQDLPAVLAEVADEPAGGCGLAEHRAAIDRCFGESSVDAISHALAAEGSPWAHEAHQTLLARSPSSLHITLALLHRTRTLSLSECLAIELRLARTVTRSADFIEGVRAVLVDKDRRPVWSAAVPSFDELLAS